MTDPQVTFEDIDPDKASVYLQHNTRNRGIRKAHVNRMAADMEAGRFYPTHQGLAFDKDGVLIDGQQRLTAIIASSAKVRLMVVRGLDPKAQEYMDGGAKRIASDFMSGHHTKVRTAACRILLGVRQLDGEITVGSLQRAMETITTAEILEAPAEITDPLEEHAPLAFMAGIRKKGTGVGASTLTAAAAVIGQDKGHEFLHGIETGENLTKGDARLAVIKFDPKRRLQTPNAAFVALKAAKAYANGDQMSLLRYKSGEILDLTGLDGVPVK